MINNKDIYSISEVAQYTGFKPHVIRFYEKEFNLIIPRGENNRRYFTNEELNQLLYIKQLQSDGISNGKIKDMLQTKQNTENNADNNENIETTALDNDKMKKTSGYNNINIEFKNEILMILEKYNYKNEINELKRKVEELTQQLNNTDKNTSKDILICENAKLKLKIKEKSYEVAELKDKLKRQENKKISIFERLLRTKNA